MEAAQSHNPEYLVLKHYHHESLQTHISEVLPSSPLYAFMARYSILPFTVLKTKKKKHAETEFFRQYVWC
jgi:hypothetical protein